MTSINKSRLSKLNSPRDGEDPYRSAEMFKLTEAKTTKKQPPNSSLKQINFTSDANLQKVGSV